MQVDPRGPRFGAAITTFVLALVLLISGLQVVVAVALLAAQALVFAVGAVAGLRSAPYGLIYRRVVRPRLGPPKDLESEAPPRFAQAVGLVFAVVGVLGFVSGLFWLGVGATAAALIAAFLNAAFGFCLGCEMYLLIRRILPSRSDKEVHA